MSAANLLGVILLLVAVALLILVLAWTRRRGARPPTIRAIEALDDLPVTVGDAVETGQRMHVSLGTGSIGQADTAATLAGLTVLEQIASVATVSDKPPVVSTSDGAAMLLAQNVLENVYKQQNIPDRYDPDSARVIGLSPISFGAAATALIKDESVAGNLIVGQIGQEAVLLAEAGQRAGTTTIASSPDPAAQAVLFAAADHPLIGEDLFAAGAYIGRKPAHLASLITQDVLRLIIVVGILMAALGKTLNLLP